MSMLLSLVTVGAAALFPQGHYAGQGFWKGGGDGDYGVTTVVEGDTLHSQYDFPDGARSFELVATATGDGFFTVTSDGGGVGHGYCYGVQCHYEVMIGGLSLEETLTFVDGKLYKLGSKTFDGGRIAWQEALSR